ncbi:MAG: hypothetical protein Q7R79_02395 [bacterium]|nr:hypothetical protein [bacterium]
MKSPSQDARKFSWELTVEPKHPSASLLAAKSKGGGNQCKSGGGGNGKCGGKGK